MDKITQTIKSISDQVWALNTLVKGNHPVDFLAWGQLFTAPPASGAFNPTEEFDYDREVRDLLWNSYLKDILMDPNNDDWGLSTEIAGRVTDMVCVVILSMKEEVRAISLDQLNQPETVLYILSKAARDAAAEKKNKHVPDTSPEKTLLEEFQDVSGKVEELRQEVKNSHPSMVSSLVVGLGAIAVCFLGGAAAAWVASRSNSDNGQNKQ